MLKRIFLFLLSLMLFVPCAFADTVTVDLDTATVDELKAARDTIDVRLAEIRIANAPDVDNSFIVSGNGTQILDGFDIVADFSRFSATCDDDIKVTYYYNNTSRSFDHASRMCFAWCIDEPISITSVMVESTGNWSVDFSPISTMDSPYTTGVGSYVTDRFSVTPPCIVRITLEAGDYYDYTNVTLWKIHSDGRTSTENMVYNEIIIDEESFDVIIKPEKDIVSYFWMINCPVDTNWSITAK